VPTCRRADIENRHRRAAATKGGPAVDFDQWTVAIGILLKQCISFFRQSCGKRSFVMTMLKVIEVLAESEKSWEDAAQRAVKEASKTVRSIKSIYLKNLEATVENGKIANYRINASISFLLEG
jgi:hypothetical protein